MIVTLYKPQFISDVFEILATQTALLYFIITWPYTTTQPLPLLAVIIQ